ncbi:alkaline phosphatase family protein [bacterium]|nr:alkaline phosphatase family protein [bacterium]
MNEAKKAVVIGIDAPITKSILRCAKEGKMPNVKKLIENGVWGKNCLVPHPTITPPNWTAIATGSWTGTHQIICFHSPGKSPLFEEAHQAFSSKEIKAEYIWEVIKEQSIILNYPTSWPPRAKNIIQIGGAGLHVNDWRMNKNGELLHLWYQLNHLSDRQLFTTEEKPFAEPIKLKKATGWGENVSGKNDYLEAEIYLGGRNSFLEVKPNRYFLLIKKGGSVSLYKDKKSHPLFTIKEGEWSEKIWDRFETEKGEREGAFIAKLLKLSENGEHISLYFTGIAQFEEGFYPAGIGEELKNLSGLPIRVMEEVLWWEWYDIDTYLEEVEIENTWLGEAANYLLKNKEWKLFFMHAHCPDHTYHYIFNKIDPEKKEDIEWVQKIEDSFYSSLDRMIGKIIEAINLEETIVIITSDHGATPTEGRMDKDFEYFNVGKILREKGLLVFKEENGEEKIDLTKSKAIPFLSVYVNVNLKSRYKSGIVKDKDYDKVREEIINALYDYTDKKTGKKPIVFALKKENARILGLYGDLVGDVVYGIRPEFSGEHGRQITTGEYSIGSMKGLFICYGAGIKKGIELERTIWLVDIVPTICYALDLPVPSTCEGAIIYQIFEDPDFKRKKIETLKRNYERVKNALQGYKHLTHSY